MVSLTLLTAAVKGFGIGAGLIIAIGSQNAFVLSSALRNQHVIAVTLTCIVIDVVLILAGVRGLGILIKSHPVLLDIATWGGAAFLLIYGAMAFRRALNPESLEVRKGQAMALRTAIATTMALSLLNPHVYLDTVVLLGSIGGQLPEGESGWFAFGACLASFCWFSLLALAGRALAPWFAKPRSWQVLDIIVGVTMWLIALSLIMA